MKDPLGIFEDISADTPPKSSFRLGGVLVIVLLVAAFFLGMLVSPNGGDRKQDRQDQQEQRDEQTAGDLMTLIFIHERNPQAIEHSLLLRDMQVFCDQNGLEGGFRALDDDLTEPVVASLITYAQTKGVTSPFVVATDSRDKPVKVAPWPATLDELKDFIR